MRSKIKKNNGQETDSDIDKIKKIRKRSRKIHSNGKKQKV